MFLEDVKSVLIIGMAGGLAKITAGLLTKKYPHLKIIGVDSRPTEHFVRTKNIEIIKMKYNRSGFEKLFRNHSFDAVFHLGRMSHAAANPRAHLAQRLDLNVMGTGRILELALKARAKKIIVLSTYHVYGALPDNPVFMDEDFPLRASIKYPELRDVVEMDQLATNWMWKNQHEIQTIVLRPSNIIGPQINNSMTKYLTAPYAPLPIDFNPVMQFIHESDMASTLVQCMDRVPTGIYNVAPDDVISIREAKRILGIPTVPVPIFLLEQTARFINKTFWSVPNYLIDYLKWSSILSNEALEEHIGEGFCQFTVKEALELLKLD